MTVTVKDYWLEAMKDVMYRKTPPIWVNSFRRIVGNLLLSVPGEAWENLGFTIEDLGYSPDHKIPRWKGFYFPTPKEIFNYEEKVRSLAAKSMFFANLPVSLKGEKTKEGSVKDTKGNCLLNAVVSISKLGKKDPIHCKVWIISRSSEIFTKFGADLYIIHELLLPKLLEAPFEVFPDMVFEEVTFYLCSAYLTSFRVMGLALFNDSPLNILMEGWQAVRSRNDKQERQFIRRALKDTIIALDNPASIQYRSRSKVSYLYRQIWLPFQDELMKLWEEIKNV